LLFFSPSPTYILPLPEGGGGFEEFPPPLISSPSQREGEDLEGTLPISSPSPWGWGGLRRGRGNIY